MHFIASPVIEMEANADTMAAVRPPCHWRTDRL